jgi:hypothetical protein
MEVGLVGLGLLLFLQNHSSLHKLSSPPSATYASDHSYERPPFQAFSTQRPVAWYSIPPLHGRLSIPRGLLQRCIAPPATHRRLARTTRPPSQPRERRLDAHPGRQPLGLKGRHEPRNVPCPTRQTPPTRTTSVLPARPGCVKRSMATRSPTRSFRGEISVMYLAIAPSRFFYRELHNVLATRNGWGGGGRPPNA